MNKPLGHNRRVSKGLFLLQIYDLLACHHVFDIRWYNWSKLKYSLCNWISPHFFSKNFYQVPSTFKNYRRRKKNQVNFSLSGIYLEKISDELHITKRQIAQIQSYFFIAHSKHYGAALCVLHRKFCIWTIKIAIIYNQCSRFISLSFFEELILHLVILMELINLKRKKTISTSNM